MDNKDYPKVRKAAMEQGWRVASTKHGETFFAPDGRTKVMVHRLHASSDARALDQMSAGSGGRDSGGRCEARRKGYDDG